MFSNWCFVHGCSEAGASSKAGRSEVKVVFNFAQVLASRPTAVVRRARYLINAGETRILPEVLRLAVLKSIVMENMRAQVL